jgi:hypothetical protein
VGFVATFDISGRVSRPWNNGAEEFPEKSPFPNARRRWNFVRIAETPATKWG